jgi:hypothetical protein
MLSWYLLPQLVGHRLDAVGSPDAVDRFSGWNGVAWGDGPLDDMVTDFDAEDGTTTYWRHRDRDSALRDQLRLGEHRVRRVLYTFAAEGLCSVGFELPSEAEFEGLWLGLHAAYGEPALHDETEGRYGWRGREIAVRLRRHPEEGAAVAWFHIPLLRASRVRA